MTKDVRYPKMSQGALHRWENPIYRELATRAIKEGRNAAFAQTLWFYTNEFPLAERYDITLYNGDEVVATLTSFTNPRARISNFVSQAKFRRRQNKYIKPEASRTLDLIEQGVRIFAKVEPQ